MKNQSAMFTVCGSGTFFETFNETFIDENFFHLAVTHKIRTFVLSPLAFHFQIASLRSQ